MRLCSAIIILSLFVQIDYNAATVTKLTNLQCENMDGGFSKFVECKLKVIKRGQVGLNIHVKLLQVPVTNAVMNMALYQKANGYKPFLYNATVDFCLFAQKAKNNIFMKIVMEFITEYSNLNHSCPYDSDVIIKDLILPEEKFRLIPLPSGEYMIKLLIFVDKTRKFDIKVNFLRVE